MHDILTVLGYRLWDLLVSRRASRLASLLSSFETFLKTAIMTTIADRHFHVLCEVERKSKLHWRAVRLALFRNSYRLLRIRKTTSSSVEFPLNTVCCLAKAEKIRIDAATSCKDREFSMLCEIATIKSSGLSFPQKVQTFREERKVWSFLELRVEIFNLADLLSIRLR